MSALRTTRSRNFAIRSPGRALADEVRFADTGGDPAKPDAYADIVRRYGIHNIVFCYSTDSFSALDADGQVLASGPTIKDVLASFS